MFVLVVLPFVCAGEVVVVVVVVSLFSVVTVDSKPGKVKYVAY